jgi:hypothetical protein
MHLLNAFSAVDNWKRYTVEEKRTGTSKQTKCILKKRGNRTGQDPRSAWFHPLLHRICRLSLPLHLSAASHSCVTKFIMGSTTYRPIRPTCESSPVMGANTLIALQSERPAGGHGRTRQPRLGHGVLVGEILVRKMYVFRVSHLLYSFLLLNFPPWCDFFLP